MKLCTEKDQRERRARLSSLLFDGAKLETTLPAAAFLEPKLPRLSGE